MTLPDSDEVKMSEQKKKGGSLETILMEVLVRARNSSRITSGVFECATQLQTDPDHVMLCLLPESAPDDIAMSIQQKLIEAYCLEYDIHVIKVNKCDKLSPILSANQSEQKTVNDKPVTMATVDCSCILIGWPPKGKKNKKEDKLMEQIWHNQVIDLPI